MRIISLHASTPTLVMALPVNCGLDRTSDIWYVDLDDSRDTDVNYDFPGSIRDGMKIMLWEEFSQGKGGSSGVR